MIFSDSTMPSVAGTATIQPIAPRHQPPSSSMTVITTASGSTTAWSPKSVRNFMKPAEPRRCRSGSASYHRSRFGALDGACGHVADDGMDLQRMGQASAEGDVGHQPEHQPSENRLADQ